MKNIKQLFQAVVGRVFGTGRSRIPINEDAYDADGNFAFNLDKDPATQKVVQDVREQFTPVVDKLNAFVPADAEGRRFRLVVQTSHKMFSGLPEINGAIGYLTELEAKATQFYMSDDGGPNAFYKGGDKAEPKRRDLDWSIVNSRSIDFTFQIGVDKNSFGEKPDYILPVSDTQNSYKIVQKLYDRFFSPRSAFFPAKYFSNAHELKKGVFNEVVRPARPSQPVTSHRPAP